MGDDSLRVQTRFSDSEEVMAVVGGALARGWLRLPLRVTNTEPFEVVLLAADGTQALRSFAEVVEPAGAATWIRFLSAAPAAETERGSRCMLAEVDVDTGEPVSNEPADDVVPSLPPQSRRGVLDVLPTVKMPALARASVPVLPPLLPPPPALAPVASAAESISAAVLAVEPTVEPEKVDLVELTTTPDKPIAFDTSDVTGEAKLFAPTAAADYAAKVAAAKVDATNDASGGELEAKIADAVAAEVAVDVPSIDARGLGNELDSVAGEIRRDTDAMPPIELVRHKDVVARERGIQVLDDGTVEDEARTPADSTIPTPFAHAPAESQAAIAASLAATVGARPAVRVSEPIATAEVAPLKKPHSRRGMIMISAATCLAAAVALVVVSTHGTSAHADAPAAKQITDVTPAPAPAPVVPVVEAPAPVVEASAPVMEAPAPVATPPAKLKSAVVQPQIAAPATTPGGCSIVIAASVEDAQVMIDGVARGEAPATVDVPCGRPIAVAVHHPRYEVYKTTITATGQESMTAKLERERTTVTVVSDPPGATVSLNGTSIGKTPLKTTVNRFEQSTFNFSETGYDADWRRIMPKSGTSQVSIKLRLSDKGASRH